MTDNLRDYALAPPPIVSLPITGSDDRFPVRRIYCVGRNYADHVREMGGDPNRSTPFFFTKSRECIVHSGSTIPYPPQTENLHYEAELVVAMNGPKDIFGYGVGLDMTRRDLQSSAKKGGKPWDMSKNFAQSAPCGSLKLAHDWNALGTASITLKNNNITKQSSTLSKMIWSVDEIINHLSNSVPLAAGDLIFTGTPDGVDPAVRGDHLRAHIDGLAPLEITYK